MWSHFLSTFCTSLSISWIAASFHCHSVYKLQQYNVMVVFEFQNHFENWMSNVFNNLIKFIKPENDSLLYLKINHSRQNLYQSQIWLSDSFFSLLSDGRFLTPLQKFLLSIIFIQTLIIFIFLFFLTSTIKLFLPQMSFYKFPVIMRTAFFKGGWKTSSFGGN